VGYGGGVRPIKFFRTIIGGLSGPEILEYLDDLKSDANKIEEEIIQLIYYTPNLTLNDAWNLTFKERQKIFTVINEIRKKQSQT
jgi:hypothetical protein